MVTAHLRSGRFEERDCRIEDMVALTRQRTELASFPHATTIEQDVVIYEAATLRQAVADGARDEVQDELVRALTDGPGVVALAGAFNDLAVVDRATAAYDEIIAAEKATGAGGNDHFGIGANDRLWNALEKLAVRDPETFVDYFSNDLLALISEAWLGPAYQVTSHVNLVRPGGVAQDPHRDYHLGFLTNAVAATYPAHVHLLSPVLTLQGAVAHTDMPVESGPTMYLPYSHQYAPGYLAWRLPVFRHHFARTLRPASAAKGRRGLLQPGPVPRRREQRVRRRAADGEPAPGLFRLRTHHGDRRPHPHDQGDLSRAARPPRGGG